MRAILSPVPARHFLLADTSRTNHKATEARYSLSANRLYGVSGASCQRRNHRTQKLRSLLSETLWTREQIDIAWREFLA